MDLVRKITVQTLIHNFTLSAKHVLGLGNSVADALSQFQMHRFQQFGVFCCVTSWQSQVRISQVAPLCNFQLLCQTQQTSSRQLHAPTPSYPKRHQTVFQFPTTNSSANHHTHLVTNFRTFASKLFRGT